MYCFFHIRVFCSQLNHFPSLLIASLMSSLLCTHICISVDPPGTANRVQSHCCCFLGPWIIPSDLCQICQLSLSCFFFIIGRGASTAAVELFFGKTDDDGNDDEEERGVFEYAWCAVGKGGGIRFNPNRDRNCAKGFLRANNSRLLSSSSSWTFENSNK